MKLSDHSPAPKPSTTVQYKDGVDCAGVLEPRVGCIAGAMEIIGSKWTALILRDLTSGPKRFTELEKSVGTINPRTLSQRLDDLEQHAIITRQLFAEVPPRSEYALTQKGYDLMPVLEQMAFWGDKYYDLSKNY